MNVRYIGPLEAVVVPWGGTEFYFARGEMAEVPDGLGEALLDQSVWASDEDGEPDETDNEEK